MRLWHSDIIPALPDKLLSVLHRDVCALRGQRWGSKSPRVKHLWNHPYGMLVQYHHRVIVEMLSREWKPNPAWLANDYRGQRLSRLPANECGWFAAYRPIPEHTESFKIRNARELIRRVIEQSGPWTEKDVKRVDALRKIAYN